MTLSLAIPSKGRLKEKSVSLFRDAGFVDDALKASVTGTLTHFGIEVSCI